MYPILDKKTGQLIGHVSDFIYPEIATAPYSKWVVKIESDGKMVTVTLLKQRVKFSIKVADDDDNDSVLSTQSIYYTFMEDDIPNSIWDNPNFVKFELSHLK